MKRPYGERLAELKRLHAAHPTWDADMLAQEMGVLRQYVTTYAAKYNLALPPAWPPAKLRAERRRLELEIEQLKRREK